MKKFILLIFIILTYSGSIYSQNVKMTDYDVPVSFAKNLRFNANYNWAQIGDSVTSNQFNSNAIYSQFYSSLPFAYNLDLNTSVSKTYNDDVRYTGVINADIRKYFTKKEDFFGFAGTQMTYEDRFDRPQINLNGGVGYGRFIDATSLAKALRIENELMKDKTLSKYLPKKTMLKIASLIEREGEFQDKYKDIYEAKLIEAIQAEIEASGDVKTGKLDALGFYRIRQVLYGINQIINPRFFGYDIRAGVSYTALTEYTSIKSPSPELALLGRFSYPINYQAQFNIYANAYTPVDSSAFKLVTGSLGTNFSYDLSNRINFTASYIMNIIRASQTSGNVTVGNNILNAAFLFYLENRVGLTINGTYEKPNGLPQRLSTSISLSYFLL
ncbi:MAG: hypothetical protein ISS16_00395 [Ignavibacteria bacterium]|nr:hypothetical protein [Ignavibacteria bacterium]